MPYLHTASEVVLYAEVFGTGPLVLFLTGSDSNLAANPEVTPFVQSLVRSVTVFAYDQRGLGSSPPGRAIPTMASFADDARNVIDAMGSDRLPVIGYSFGGMVAQEVALRHPDRVESLVLLNTSSGGAGGSSYPLHELRNLPDGERHERSIGLWDTRRDRSWRTTHPDEYAAAVAELARFDAAVSDPARGLGMAHQLEARSHHDTYDRLPKISVPTLVIGGHYDGIAPLANCQALVRRIPGATLAVFQGGHRVLWQDNAVGATIARFIVRGWRPVSTTSR